MFSNATVPGASKMVFLFAVDVRCWACCRWGAGACACGGDDAIGSVDMLYLGAILVHGSSARAFGRHHVLQHTKDLHNVDVLLFSSKRFTGAIPP